jgi:hypothetical protein
MAKMPDEVKALLAARKRQKAPALKNVPVTDLMAAMDEVIGRRLDTAVPYEPDPDRPGPAGATSHYVRTGCYLKYATAEQVAYLCSALPWVVGIVDVPRIREVEFKPVFVARAVDVLLSTLSIKPHKYQGYRHNWHTATLDQAKSMVFKSGHFRGYSWSTAQGMPQEVKS